MSVESFVRIAVRVSLDRSAGASGRVRQFTPPILMFSRA